MIVGVGTDLVENRRIERELSCAPWCAADGIFTAAEILRSNTSANPILEYATCFAIKESVLKALGTGACSLRDFADVEVQRRKSAYMVRLHGRARDSSVNLKVRAIKVSVVQHAGHTVATAILES